MSDQATATIETGTIYFVTLALASQVYVMGGGIGLTDYLNLFCWGDTPEEAEENAKAYLLGTGIGVKKVLGKTTPALKQDPASYTFPEQICGLPDSIAMKAIRSRGYPDCIVEDTLKTLRKRQSQLRVGRQRRAAQTG